MELMQGCLLVPTHFSILLSVMLMDAYAFCNEDRGVRIRFRMDGGVFNLRRFGSQIESLVRESYLLMIVHWLLTVLMTSSVLFGRLCQSFWLGNQS